MMRVAAAAPTATGGTIADGTYYATKWEEYTGPGGATGPTSMTIKEMYVISNATPTTATVNRALTISPTGATDTRQTSTWNFAGSTISVSVSCPKGPGAGSSLQYSAAASEFKVNMGGLVTTFTKQ